MDIAAGDGHTAGDGALAGMHDAGCVGAAAQNDLILIGDAVFFGSHLHKGHHLGAADDRNVLDLDGGTLADGNGDLLTGAQIVAVGADVDGNAEVGLDAGGGGDGALEADLLLYGKDIIDVVVALVDLLHGHQQNDAGSQIVAVWAHEAVVADDGRLGVEHGQITEGDHRFGLGAAGCGNVDIQVGQGDGGRRLFGPVALILQLDDAADAVFKADGGMDEGGGIVAADIGEGQIALLADVGDDQADDVHVGGKHQALAGALLVADQAAGGGEPHLVAVGLGQLGQQLAAGTLVARGQGGLDQLCLDLQNVKHCRHTPLHRVWPSAERRRYRSCRRC